MRYSSSGLPESFLFAAFNASSPEMTAIAWFVALEEKYFSAALVTCFFF